MPQPTAEGLHLTDKLFSRIKKPGVELPVYLVRPQLLHRWLGNQINATKLTNMTNCFTDLQLSDPLLVNIYFQSGLVVVFEGNHRVEAALCAGWKWLPVCFAVQYGTGHRSEFVSERLSLGLNTIDISGLKQFDELKRESYMFASHTLSRELLAWVGVETLDPSLNYKKTFLDEHQPERIKPDVTPRRTPAEFHLDQIETGMEQALEKTEAQK